MTGQDPAVMVTNPEQRYVPVEKDDRIVPGCRRHVEDCVHFYPKADPADHDQHLARLALDPNARVSYVREATPDEMRVTPPCSTCGVVPERPTVVETCPRCQMLLPATGECDCSA